MIKLDNVSLVFQGGSVALSNISTTINEGEFIYLVGHSGSGKSSFLKLLYKEYISTKGSIEVAGLDVVQLPRWKTPLLRRKLGIVTQEPQLLEKRNTYENIAFALEVMGTPNDEIESKTNTLLDLVELNENAFKYPDQLSGGEQTRVSIARSLGNNPLVLLCAVVVTLSSRKITTCVPFCHLTVLFCTIDLAERVVKTKKLDTNTAIIVAKTSKGVLLILRIVFFITYENLFMTYLRM